MRIFCWQRSSGFVDGTKTLGDGMTLQQQVDHRKKSQKALGSPNMQAINMQAQACTVEIVGT